MSNQKEEFKLNIAMGDFIYGPVSIYDNSNGSICTLKGDNGLLSVKLGDKVVAAVNGKNGSFICRGNLLEMDKDSFQIDSLWINITECVYIGKERS